MEKGEKMYLKLFLILVVSGTVLLLLLRAAVMAGEEGERPADLHQTSAGRVKDD